MRCGARLNGDNPPVRWTTLRGHLLTCVAVLVSAGMATCDEHAWASVGVTVVEGTVTRVWVCERCLAWTRESLTPDAEVPWDETVIADH